MARNTNVQGNWVTTPVTPYRLAAILSKALTEALEAPFEIAPQQIYGAVRSGSLATEMFDSGHKKVTPEVANAFIQARIDRQLNKGKEAEATESEQPEGDAKEAVAS